MVKILYSLWDTSIEYTDMELAKMRAFSIEECAGKTYSVRITREPEPTFFWQDTIELVCTDGSTKQAFLHNVYGDEVLKQLKILQKDN